MDRYRAEYPKDDASASDGDTQFLGVNMKLSPEQLGAGMVSEAVNKSFRTGQGSTRGGLVTIIHFNPRQAGANDFSDPRVWGSGQYADADGNEWMLLARSEAAWRLRDGVTPTAIPFPELLAVESVFVQFANWVYLFRGQDLKPWRWDGTPAGEWELLNQLDPGDSTTPIPGADSAEVVADRLLIQTERDGVIFTDIDEGQFYDEAELIRVNHGTNDTLVRLFPYANSSVLAFKTRSVYSLDNVTGDLSSITLTTISTAVGCVASRAVVQVGADVWFLGANGIYRVSQVIQDRIQTDPIPISEPMAPFFRERVNWAAIAGATAATLAEYVYWALPIDGATENTAVLVFNAATQQWEGWWTFPQGNVISEFVTVDYLGRKRLFGVDRPRGFVYLMDEGPVDRIFNAFGPDFVFDLQDSHVETFIADRLVTRGYLVGTNDTKVFTRVAARMATSNPMYSLGIDTGDVSGAQTLLSEVTKSRFKYYTFGMPDYVATNVHDDHATPHREDYSIQLASQPRTGDHGIECDRKQTHEARVPTRARSRYLSLILTNESGVCDVLSTSVEARQVNRSTRTQL